MEENIKDLDAKYKQTLEEDCLICYSELENPIMVQCCQNVFCGKCLFKWLESHKTCPMCRYDLDVSKFMYINKNDNKDEKEEKKEEIEEKKKKFY